MAKETKIEVSCVFDGGPDVSDVFVSLIAERIKRGKEGAADPEDMWYDEDEVQTSHCPSGECA